MPLHAHAVLADCEAAFIELKAATQETLRRRWFTTIALLRAVGHVLHKVDGEGSPELGAAVKKHFDDLKARKPEPRIFWGFIEKERNDVMKLYQFSVRGNQTIGVQPGTIGTITSPFGTTYAPESRFDVWPLIAGSFAGEQPFDVVQQAIDFWREGLDKIERAVV
jgi:hypothetical protein